MFSYRIGLNAYERTANKALVEFQLAEADSIDIKLDA
jgi:hypothetical protein